MDKFKLGQTVRCIDIGEHGTGGAGWRKDTEFTVTRITHDGDRAIYWESEDHCGVYEYALELVIVGKFKKGDKVRYKRGGEETVIEEVVRDVNRFTYQVKTERFGMCGESGDDLELVKPERKREMKIRDLRKNVGLEGIEVTGKIVLVKPGKTIVSSFDEGKEFHQQFVVLEDGSDKGLDSILVQVRNQPAFNQNHVGHTVIFKSRYVESQNKAMGVKIAKFEDEKGEEKEKIVVTNSAEILFEEKPVLENAPKETVVTKLKEKGEYPNMMQSYKNAVAVAHQCLKDEEVKAMIKELMVLGYASEFVRTLIISFFIEINRRNKEIERSI